VFTARYALSTYIKLIRFDLIGSRCHYTGYLCGSVGEESRKQFITHTK
jgi:hypothetical protein